MSAARKKNRIRFFVTAVLSRAKVGWLKRRLTIISEYLRGLDYSSTSSQASLGLSPKAVNLGSPSVLAVLEEVVERLQVSNSDRLLDVGCAKGYALSYFIQHLDCKVAGIEISAKLAKICRRNIRRQYGVNIEVHNEDATQFKAFGDFNYFYMYNPFPNEEILEVVVSRIVQQSKEDVVLIYNNPRYENIILKKRFDVIDEFTVPESNNKRVKIYKRSWLEN